MSNAQLQAEVKALRERIAVEKIAKAQRDAAGTDEHRAGQLALERDRLKAELASVLGVDVAKVQVPEGVVLTEEVSGVSTVVPEGVVLTGPPPSVEVTSQPAKPGKPDANKNDPAAPGVPT